MSPSDILAFSARYEVDRRAEPPSPLSLHTSIRLIRFHKKVIRYFASDFSSSILVVHPMSKESMPCYSPLSFTETRRIHRAFYRVELYYKLFGGSQWQSAEWFGFRTPTIKFLGLFPPWELEELRCVHDFLHRRLLASYIAVAEHDARTSKSGTRSGHLRGELLTASTHSSSPASR